jgi:hypothetical protein
MGYYKKIVSTTAVKFHVIKSCNMIESLCLRGYILKLHLYCIRFVSDRKMHYFAPVLITAQPVLQFL